MKVEVMGKSSPIKMGYLKFFVELLLLLLLGYAELIDNACGRRAHRKPSCHR
jgi:hypothetical protein